MTSLIHRRVASLVSLASFAFLAFNALFTAPVSAQGDVRQPNMEWVESHLDLSVKVAGGSVAVRRTWSRGQWYVNFAWADLKFTRDPLDNTIKLIDRGGSVFERQGGTTAYTPGSAAPAADAIGTSYVFDRQYVIRRTNTG